MLQTYSITITSVSLTTGGPAAVTLSWAAPNDTGEHVIGTFSTDAAGFFNPPVVFPVPGPGPFTVYARSCNCTFSKSFFALTKQVPELPPTPSITGPAQPCPLDTGIIYSIAPVAHATSYTWTVPTGWTFTPSGDGLSITVTAGTEGQSGSISVIAHGPDGDSPAATLAVTVAAGAPKILQTGGAGTYCPGANVKLWAEADKPTTFAWTMADGWKLVSTQAYTLPNSQAANVIAGPTPSKTTGIQVKASTGCDSSAATIQVATNKGVITGTAALSGPASVLPHATGLVYKAVGLAGVNTYQWTVPAGWQVTAGLNTSTITVTSGATAQNGQVQVVATGDCDSRTLSMAVTVQAAPVLTCDNFTDVSVVLVSGNQYQYTFSGGSIAVGDIMTLNWYNHTSGALIGSTTMTATTAGTTAVGYFNDSTINITNDCTDFAWKKNCVNGLVTSLSAKKTVGTCYQPPPLPSIGLGSPICRIEGNCNGDTCGILYSLNIGNAPAGSTVAVTNTSGSAQVLLTSTDPSTAELKYEENGVGSCTFTLQVKDSTGKVLTQQVETISHQPYWSMMNPCP